MQAGLPNWTVPAKGRHRRDELAARIRSAIASIASNPEFRRLGLLLSLRRQPAERRARLLFKETAGACRQHGFVLATSATYWPRRAPGLPELLARIAMAAADGLLVSAQIDSDCDHDRFADLLADMLEASATRAGSR